MPPKFDTNQEVNQDSPGPVTDQNQQNLSNHAIALFEPNSRSTFPESDISKALNLPPLQIEGLESSEAQNSNSNIPEEQNNNDFVVTKNASDATANAVGKHMESLSSEVKSLLKDHGVKVVVTGNLSDHDPEYAGLTPRGWPPGTTADMAGGFYDPDSKEVVVNESIRNPDGEFEKREVGEIDNSTAHEVGHAVDDILCEFSESRKFKRAYNKDVKNLSGVDRETFSYFLESEEAGRAETFAEVFADLEGEIPTGPRSDVLDKFPNVRKVVEEKLAKTGNKLCQG